MTNRTTPATTPQKTLKLTVTELAALREALYDIAMEMDDDGRDGAFDASPLAAVLRKVKAA